MKQSWPLWYSLCIIMSFCIMMKQQHQRLIQPVAAAADANAKRKLQARIVNGQEAPEGRYPYAASLASNGRHFCGGSVIAPDMVLTAAHCQKELSSIRVQIGRHDFGDYFDWYENLRVRTKYVHPRYQSGQSFRHDQMILRLRESSTLAKPLIRLNSNSNIPTVNQEVTVMGWGVLIPGDETSASPTLQEVTLNVISNQRCEKSKDPNFVWTTYQGLITDDMMCAFDDGEDSCQGDSGGPLIVRGRNASADVQVGIVSWGWGCAKGHFPGVYSRTSYDFDWIRNIVCEYSSAPPSYFACPDESTTTPQVVTPVTPQPTARPPSSLPPTEPPTPPPGTVKVVVTIQMDRHPEEVGWRIDRLGFTSENVIQRQPRVYTTLFQEVVETLYLDRNELYSFTIYDVQGDGLCCNYGKGGYSVTVNGNEVIRADGAFGSGADHTFVTTLDGSSADNNNNNNGGSVIAEGDLFVTLEILFDKFPEENGWVLRHDSADPQSNPFVDFRTPRSYSKDLAEKTVVEQIKLPPEGGSFSFHFTDSFGDGICCKYGQGKYTLYQGSIQDNQVLGTGNAFNSGRQVVEFQIAASMEQETTAPAPTVSPAPAMPLVPVDIYLQPDDFPRDIAWRIENEEGNVVISRPFGTYTTGLAQSEQVMLHSDSLYEFVIIDGFENGICCNSGVGVYSITTDNGLVGYGGKFKAQDRKPFVTPGFYPLELKLKLDNFPKETSWTLSRVDLEKTATVSLRFAGSYETKGQLDTRVLLVQEGGLYRLTLSDKEADGICCRHGQGAVQLTVNPDSGGNEDIIVSRKGDFFGTMNLMFVALSPRPILGNVVGGRQLELKIDFDRFPEEITWFLTLVEEEQNEVQVSNARSSGESSTSTSKKSTLVAFGPKEPYSRSAARSTIRETIFIEQIPKGSTRTYTFVILDSAEDGLCCLYGTGEYELRDGNNVLAKGDMAGKERDVHTFSLTRSGVQQAAPTFAPLPPPDISSNNNDNGNNGGGGVGGFFGSFFSGAPRTVVLLPVMALLLVAGALSI